MPSLIDIRRRIRSVKNMQQITKAMKMVSAAKLRRAQERAIAARPYGTSLDRMLANVAAAASANEDVSQPLLAVREEKSVQLVVVTSDPGLAGAFNANILRMAQKFIDDNAGKKIQIEAIGRKGRDYFRRRGVELSGVHIGIVDKPSYDTARKIADKLIERYSKAEVDAVYICVNEFKNVMAPNLALRRILPVTVPESAQNLDYIYEEPPQELLSALLPRYVEVQLYRALLESNSAEHAARMTAMDAASSNAGDVIDTLTLNMNRVRQAKITREIIEIVGGAAAL
ncbi:MAG TPA: ATP synthase F1 subunit gamma [Bryobacteraceae bacterium]|nr:ATP synthase F1 subunit gamma [Bryobacteraceae bacterium]